MIARRRMLNLVCITDTVLADELLPRMLPSQWKGMASTEWTPGQADAPTEAWMGLLWQKLQVILTLLLLATECRAKYKSFPYLLTWSLCLQDFSSLQAFAAWPLLRTEDWVLVRLQPLQHSNVVLKDPHWPAHLATGLTKLGYG